MCLLSGSMFVGFMTQLCEISSRRERKGLESGHGFDLQTMPVVSPHHFVMDIDRHFLSRQKLPLFALVVRPGMPEILLCAWISLLLTRWGNLYV